MKEEKNNSSLLTPDSSLLINLPQRNDTDTEVFVQHDFHEGSLKFEGQEFVFPSGLRAEAIAKWLESDLLSVEIKISAEIDAPCARCLKTVNLEISDKLMYLYYLQGAEAFDDFDDYMPVEVDYFGRVIDIMPQINESVFTLLPTKILCKEDCKGLCPNCGKDLNEGPCSCEIESIDPRLEALRNFNFS
ncbi:MAG: DUF177 domain-containing protein [Synergistaceae bacterium]|nr:DUF177 domain-containing protein [Synergistaceae bacterium]